MSSIIRKGKGKGKEHYFSSEWVFKGCRPPGLSDEFWLKLKPVIVTSWIWRWCFVLNELSKRHAFNHNLQRTKPTDRTIKPGISSP